jgi:hypothetical protein
MKWLKLFVFVIYCVLLYLVMYVFPHEKAVPTHNQVQFLSIGSIVVFVIVVVAIGVWERRGARGLSCKKKK